MLEKKVKSGLATLLVLATTIITVILWPKDEATNTSQTHKILVKFELGTKEMELDEYIAGVICNYEKWLDYDNLNAEMIKTLAVFIRTRVAFTMQDMAAIEAEKLPLNYAGYNSLIRKYGTNAKEKIEFIKEAVRMTNGIILEKDSHFTDCSMDLEKARELAQKGTNFDMILVELFQEYTMSISFL